MEFVTGSQLVEKLRSLCNKVRKRLWIASPFIKNWTNVRKILGREWVDNGEVTVRLLTDISEVGNLNYGTIKCFRARGEIKTLTGLHAKIYIIDDFALVTSANLTGTAFSKRHEIGIILSKNEAQPLISIYNDWWENLAENIPSDWLPSISSRTGKKEREETLGKNLKVLWKLPSDPGDPFPKLTPRFLDYDSFLKKYRDFAEIYTKIQRLWPKTPLFFETDAFLNYLFHHAKDRPTRQYIKGKPRKLNRNEREKEIKKYASLFKKWLLKEGSEDVETSQWREEGTKIIRKLLSREKIQTLNYKEIKQVVDKLNCMNSVPIVKSKFLNPENNDINTIRKAWSILLYGSAPLQIRMSECKNNLKSFGRSSIHELLGYFDPTKYPLRNRNSSAGLRFFGYDVSVY
jgi:hypothetical protein